MPEDRQPPIDLQHRALPVLLFVVTVAFIWILLPFYGAVMWAAIIAMLFAPIFRKLLARLNGRRTAAALLVLLLVVAIVLVPFMVLSAALAREAVSLFEQIKSGELDPAALARQLFDALPAPLVSLLNRFGLANFDALQGRLTATVAQGSQLIATRALSIGQGTFEFVADLFITAYIAFFLIRDGEGVSRAVRRAIPLAPAHKQDLLDKFVTVVRATVKGNLLVAAVQGALGGLAFWFLDVRAALLWAVLMAFLALLPAIGSALVWFPVAVFFAVTGELWKGFGLFAYGVLVIGLIDNLLRPVLVGKDTRMPDYVVLISTLGGMAVLGINGFVVGPVIAAMFIATWHIANVTRGVATDPHLKP